MRPNTAGLTTQFSKTGRCHVTQTAVRPVVNDPRTEVCPAQVRYAWEGTTHAGEHLHSTQLYYPHTPSRARASTNNPGAKTVYAGGEIAATAGASAIKVIIDTLETTLILTEFKAGHFERMLFNPQGRQINNESFGTDARYAYVSVKNDTVDAYICIDASVSFRQACMK